MGISSKADANPWRGYRHRHGWYAEGGYYGPHSYYRYYPVMRYEDGCRRYCPKYDGCRRCYQHSKVHDHYDYKYDYRR